MIRRSWWSFQNRRYKTLKSPPLDLDPTRQILPPRFNPGRHNSVLRARAFDDLRWSASPRGRSVWCRNVSLNLTVIILFKRHVHDQIWWSACPSDRDPSLLVAPHHLHYKRPCGLVPHGNQKEIRPIYKTRRS